MGRFCCVIGCSSRSEREKSIRLFNVPLEITHQGVQTRELSKKRRELWLANINREDVSNGTIKTPQVCSRHFHRGISLF